MTDSELQHLAFIEGQIGVDEFERFFHEHPTESMWEERIRCKQEKEERETQKKRFSVRLPLDGTSNMMPFVECETFDGLCAVLHAVLVRPSDGPKRLEIQIF